MTTDIKFLDSDGDPLTNNSKTAYTDTAIHVFSSDVEGPATSADPSILKTRYHWNFGDTGAQYNELDGFNAAHVYAAAGTYTITLTITNPDGTPQSPIYSTVTISARTYSHTVYVDSVAGNDSNNGSTESLAVKTFGRAEQRLN